MAKKTVNYNGKKYKVDHEDYGITNQVILINGENSTFHISNDNLDDISSWKKEVTKAIIEYEVRATAREEFDKWDGKL